MLTAFGKEIRRVRDERDLTQATMAHLLGVSAGYISSIENGSKKIPKGLIPKIENILNLSGSEVERLKMAANHSKGYVEKFEEMLLSEEETEAEWNRFLIHRQLKELAQGYRFSINRHNYKLVYEPEYNEVTIAYDTDQMEPMTVYFDDYRLAEWVIEEIGEEKLIRDYFGIEEEEE